VRTSSPAPSPRVELPALDGVDVSPRPSRLASRGRRRHRATGRAALVLLPAVAVLGVVGTLLVAESATAAAVGEQIASLQTRGGALQARADLLQSTLAEVRSAGAVEAGATAAGLGPPLAWARLVPAATGPADPLNPVLRVLGVLPAAPARPLARTRTITGG